MPKIIDFEFSYMDELETIFLENTPHYFDPKEWQDFINYILHKHATYFAMMDSKTRKIVGAGGYHLVDNSLARLSWDFISAKHQKKGFGKLIIEHCLKIIKETTNILKIEVWTSQFATSFYSKFGFKTIEHQKDFWSKNIDLYKMILVLKE